ncbi:alpha/beta-hydrolase [Pluteus cervinus]|uniref:Alpha/beta-hydrolase n=1 Tax=Pluteus cervinus TaxID=181527 RepID=A0ACD3AFT0_9AGAR|nr:alpha/beta-hydrolase [Pluteus cervinus]
MASHNSAEHKLSWVVPGRYPPPGISDIADAIRRRRGERGLTPLDGTLLHVPPVAEGWNALLGAVRTKGQLPGDVRELMILRVAVLNHAKFEWVHHEHVGREAGLTTAQLFIVRNTTAPLPPPPGILSPLQAAALVFADQNTRSINVLRDVVGWLKSELTSWVANKFQDIPEEEKKALVEDLLVEAGAVVATYNMVSRFLVSLDVAGASMDPVPWPLDRQESSSFFIAYIQHFIPIPNESNPSHKIHAVTLTSDPSAPWLVFANSLLTDLSMWDLLIPYLLSSSTPFNILLHSQRGHGKSTLPINSQNELTTINALAQDLHYLLVHLGISLPVRAVIGVSQGGAVALSFGNQFPGATQSVVACDTGPKTPPGNKEAWEERIELAEAYARSIGMDKLAEVTVPRWFSSSSPCHPDPDALVPYPPESSSALPHFALWIHSMISTTPVQGFAAGARALSDYDLIADGLLASDIKRVLLIAGELDGAGKVGAGLQKLRDDWNEVRVKNGRGRAEFVGLPSSGHLPMVDRTEEFAKVLLEWLSSV